MVNVLVNSKKKVLVTANTLTAADVAITLKNTIGYGAAAGRLDQLRDVHEPANPANGDTLVYHSANDTYVVQKLDIGDVAGVDVLNIDGGSF